MYEKNNCNEDIYSGMRYFSEKKISIQEVKDQIEEGNLVNWLKDEYMTDQSFYIGRNSFSTEDLEIYFKIKKLSCCLVSYKISSCFMIYVHQ